MIWKFISYVPRTLKYRSKPSNKMAQPCVYCGKMTRNFCDGQRCESQPLLFSRLCSECETKHRLCPQCVQAGSEPWTVPDKWHQQTVKSQTSACARCSFPNPRYRCSRCSAAMYCDLKCQKSDWKRHKALTCRNQSTDSK